VVEFYTEDQKRLQERVERSRHVSDAAGEAPLPGWKRIEMVEPVPREDEQARGAEAGVIDEDTYKALVREGRG
jgi:hypothetical protein